MTTFPFPSTRICALLLLALSGCVVPVGDYDGGGYGYVGGYYEPYGYEYGGWGPGYRVGPPRGGERHGRAQTQRSFRSAPSHRSTPSIPTRSRQRH